MVNKLMKIKLKLLNYKKTERYLNVCSSEFLSFRDMNETLNEYRNDFIVLFFMDKLKLSETKQLFEYRLLIQCQSMITEMIDDVVARCELAA